MDKILVNLDYVNRKTSASLMFVGLETGYLAPIVARVFDEDGVLNQQFTLNQVSGYNFVTTFRGGGSFGIDFTSRGYDTSIYRTDLSGVYFSDQITSWVMYSPWVDLGEQNIISDLLDTHVALPNTIDKRHNVYLNNPVLITKGDAVYQGKIDTVTNSNYVSFTNDRSLASYMSYNLDNSIIQVLSGSASGQTFSITSYSTGETGAYVDRDCTSLSGQIVKIMPYRVVNGYSGWPNFTINYLSSGSAGIKTRFSLSENIPNKLGSIYYTSGTYSGATTTYHPLDTAHNAQAVPASVVTLVSDTYLRDIRTGDLVFYNPTGSPAAIATGVILHKTSHNVPAVGNIAITYWPTGVPSASSTYTIFRGNDFSVQSFPKFDSNYMLSLDGVSGANLETIFRSPSAELEMVANEYESTYSVVPATAHFQFGPVRLSNGQILDDTLTMTGGVPPFLWFSGQIINGDVNSPTTLVNKTMFSTQNTNIGQNYDGMYYKDGIFTIASDTSFNASETLICKVSISYGSAKIDRVFTVPVQPAI
jgi:hypothetical protein